MEKGKIYLDSIRKYVKPIYLCSSGTCNSTSIPQAIWGYILNQNSVNKIKEHFIIWQGKAESSTKGISKNHQSSTSCIINVFSRNA